MTDIKNIIPSWLTSWVAWRDFYTTDDRPFNALKEQFSKDTMPTSGEFLASYSGECPYCHNGHVLKNTELGLIYCICKMLTKIEELEERHKVVRTLVSKAYLSEIVYPKEMGDSYEKEMSKAVSLATSFIHRPDHWVLLSGKVGCGKTHILKAINTAFYPMALYISAGNLENHIHKFRKEDELDTFFATLTKAPILIIDDIGMEHGGPLVKSTIEKIVDSRYEAFPDMPTLFATNMLAWEIKEYIPRASDRILDMKITRRAAINSAVSFRSISPEKRL